MQTRGIPRPAHGDERQSAHPHHHVGQRDVDHRKQNNQGRFAQPHGLYSHLEYAWKDLKSPWQEPQHFTIDHDIHFSRKVEIHGPHATLTDRGMVYVGALEDLGKGPQQVEGPISPTQMRSAWPSLVSAWGAIIILPP